MNESYRHGDGKSMLFLTALLSCTKEACKDFFFFLKGENSGLYTLQFMVKRKKTVTQACRPTALKRTDERIKNYIILLDLSSPASSESVMFLSRTGAGGLETRLTEAIGERICLPSLPVQRVS